jgi:hypothetical protein
VSWRVSTTIMRILRSGRTDIVAQYGAMRHAGRYAVERLRGRRILLGLRS